MKRRTFLARVAILILVTLSSGCLGGKDEIAEAPPLLIEPTSQALTRSSEGATPLEPVLGEVESPRVRPADGMLVSHIPAGEFLMGDDASPLAAEKPAHRVNLGAYWIDHLEVTNAQYRLCVEAGVCSEPKSWKDGNLNGDNQPVLVVWEAAQAYCEWAGGRLPTEAEWEKAARGTGGHKWPWGNAFDSSLANLNGDADGYGFTAPVGSFPGGASPYGLLDMAGNAAEWVSDWYDAEYYARSPTHNPSGPASGKQRSVRGTVANGGGGPEKCRAVARFPQDPVRWEFGFRCVSSVPPDDEAQVAPLGEAAPPPTTEAPAEEPAPAPATAEAASTSATAEPTPAPTTVAATAEPTPAPSTEAPTEEPTPAPSGKAVAWDGSTGLNSYREVTVMRDGGPGGAVLSELTAEWSAATSASWYTVGYDGGSAMEQITIGNTRWARMADKPWIETTLAQEDRAAWESKMSLAQLWGDPGEVEADLEAVLPAGIELVPAQIFPLDIKSALVLDGEETVNSVHCRRYAVDTDLAYSHAIPGGGEIKYTGHAKGVIWVADQSGIPPVIVRAWMDEVLITDGKESHPYWEHNITNINQSITIEPPV